MAERGDKSPVSGRSYELEKWPDDDPRFRIDLSTIGDGWKATVYDLADHGLDLPYAEITAGSLDQVLDQATHYVLVASDA